MAQFPNTTDWVWAQEEPLTWELGVIFYCNEAATKFRPASRRYYGAPAAGSAMRFQRRHQQVIDYVFDPSQDNFIRKVKK